jgi:hypothetical protein
MKKLFILLFVFALGVSVTTLSYDVPLRHMCFYTVNTSYPVVAFNSKVRQYGWSKAQLKLPVPASYALLRR